jgi:hypothetical protein
VTVNGDADNAKSSTIATVPNSPHAATSALRTDQSIQMDNYKAVDVEVYDMYDNAIQDRQPIVQVVSGQNRNYYDTFALKTEIDTATSAPNEYETTYAVSSGSGDVSYCGFYTLSAFLLVQGGLEGSYYANRWFSSEPYLTKVDSNINHQWGAGDLIEDVASNYVSIEWNGFLMPEHSESYVFEANFNDGMQLWIDDGLIIDNLVDATSEENGYRIQTVPIALAAGKFTPIRIRYYEAVDKAFVELSWKTASASIPNFVVIPSTSFYYKRSHTPISGASALIEASHKPMRPTNVHQSDSSTYAADDITLEWTAPVDTGCKPITDYKI